MATVDVASQQLTGGPTAQVRRLGRKVDSRLVLFCIHRVNRVNSRNDSESCKHCPSIIIIIIIIMHVVVFKSQ